LWWSDARMRVGDRSCQYTVVNLADAIRAAWRTAWLHRAQPCPNGGDAFTSTTPIRTPCGTDRGVFGDRFIPGLPSVAPGYAGVAPTAL
jgi:hypothetical protein